jgi:hypothetical protein
MLDRPVFSSPRQHPPGLFDIDLGDAEDEEDEEDEDKAQGITRLDLHPDPKHRFLYATHPIGPGQFSPFLIHKSSQPLARRSPESIVPLDVPVSSPRDRCRQQDRPGWIYHDPVPTLVMSDTDTTDRGTMTMGPTTVITPDISFLNEMIPETDQKGVRRFRTGLGHEKPSDRARLLRSDKETGLLSASNDVKGDVKPLSPSARRPRFQFQDLVHSRLHQDHQASTNSIPIDLPLSLSTVREEMTRHWVDSSSFVEAGDDGSFQGVSVNGWDRGDAETLIPFRLDLDLGFDGEQEGDAQGDMGGGRDRVRRRGRKA